jgi:hypothetical protein
LDLEGGGFSGKKSSGAGIPEPAAAPTLQRMMSTASDADGDAAMNDVHDADQVQIFHSGSIFLANKWYYMTEILAMLGFEN